MKQKNKKAILMPETLKIILAVLGIIILIYLAVNLFGLFVKNTDERQAQATLNNLYSAIKQVENKEKKSAGFLAESPNGWWILTWPTDDGAKPNQCKSDYCICLCPDKDLEDCNNKGVCKNSLIPIFVFNKQAFPDILKIEGVTSLNISLEWGEIIIRKTEKEETSPSEDEILLN